MPREESHPDLQRPPWLREHVYRVPSMRAGRPDLPGIEQEIEGLGRLIGTLPKITPWWPGQKNVYEVAYEVRMLLDPRISIVTFGRGDLYAENYLWGPGGAEGRCADLCLPHPTEDAWAVVEDRTLLLRGERARSRLTRSVLRSAARAIQEVYGRHWPIAPELMGEGGP